MFAKFVKPRFNITAAEVKRLAEEVVAATKKVDRGIVAVPREQRTFQNVIKPLLQLNHSSQGAFGSIGTLIYVSTDKAVRDAANEGDVLISQNGVERCLQNDLYTAISEFNDDRKKRGETYEADIEKYIEDFLTGMRRHGAHLSVEKRKEYETVKKKIVENENAFNRNLAEEKVELRFTKEELAGLSDNTLAILDRDGDKYIITMKYPHVIPVMETCSVSETRRIVFTAFGKRGGQKNLDILEDTLKLRKQAVSILGYKDFPTYALENTMAGTPEKMRTFLYDLYEKLRESGKKEIQMLTDFKHECGEEGELEAWDYSYYISKLKEKLYQVDNSKIQEYFPTDHVVKEMMKIYQEIFGLVFKEIEYEDIWFKDVKTYSVQTKDGTYRGIFFLDLYPRDGKYTHACCEDIQNSSTLDGDHHLPVASMICNFPPSTPEIPSTISHEDVTTLFHEFGHLIHVICNNQRLCRFGSFCDETDFVETPSQLMEQWTWQKPVLQRLSKHYQTGNPLPDSLIDNMINSKNFCSALFNLRQLSFGIFDYEVHAGELTTSALEMYNKITREISLRPVVEDSFGPASFGHIMSPMYACGYYSYLWSLVYSCDIFSMFKEKGIYNEEEGTRLREKVLSKGASMKAVDMLNDYLQREPKMDAFLEEIGLSA